MCTSSESLFYESVVGSAHVLCILIHYVFFMYYEVYNIMQFIVGVSQYHMIYLNILQFPIAKIIPMKFQYFHFPGKLLNFFEFLKSIKYACK